MEPSNSISDELVVSYLKLRRLIGAMGIALPLLVTVIPVLNRAVFGEAAPLPEMKPSISEYYGSPSRDVFVGVLLALAAFLGTYRGHADGQLKLFGRELLGDNGLANISATCAFATALFPVTSDHCWVRGVHVAAAALLFVTFVIFSLFQFTRGNDPKRNPAYRACGGLVAFCLASIGIYKLSPAAQQAMPYLILYLEAAMLFAFGVAWTIKGRWLESESSERPPT